MNEREQIKLNERLMSAAQEGNIEQARRLIEAGADVSGGDTPLHKAAKNGHTEIVVLLLDEGADINALGNNKNTPLHLATEEDHEEVVEVLLERGADVALANRYGRVPLHSAAENDNEGIARLLCEKGADVNVYDNDGNAPLHLATKKRNVDMVEFLCTKGADVLSDDCNLLHLAVKAGNYHIVGCFLDEGVDVNVEDSDGYTALHFAAEGGDYDDVEFLLYKGANVNTLSNDGNAPLHLAAKNGNCNNVEILLERRAIHTGSPNDDGDSPVDLAGKNNHKDVMRLFLQKGENIGNNRDLLETIIKYAVLFDMEEVRPNYVVNNDELSGFWDNCQGEVNRMQDRMLGNTDVSLCRFMQQTDQNKLANYLSKSNIGVREYFEGEQYTENFPIYASTIKNQFSKAKEQKNLMNKSNTVMDHSDNWKKLPSEIKSEITNYLTNEDLENITEVPFSAPNQNLDNPNAEPLQGANLAR